MNRNDVNDMNMHRNDMNDMRMHRNSTTTRTLSWIIVLLGIWEFVSPFVLGFTNLGSATLNAYIVGVLLVIFGLIAALTGRPGVAMTFSWLNALLGLWLIIAPFVLGFAALTGAGMLSSIIVGVVTLVLGIWAAVAAGRYVRTREMAPAEMGAVPVTGSGMEMEDNTLQTRIMDRLSQDPRVDASMIDVDVNHGDVILRGTVPSSEEKMAAEDVARRVSGVKNVRDDLRVG